MQIPGERVQDAPEGAVVDPALKPPMTGLIRRIPFGQILPGGTGAEHPEDAIEHVPRIAPRTTASVATHAGLRQEQLENRPLLLGEVHTLRYDGPRHFVHSPALGFMR